MTKWFHLRLQIKSDRGIPFQRNNLNNLQRLLMPAKIVIITFSPPQHGEVDCWPLDCPPTPECLAPVLLPGACCPSCPAACNTNSSCGPHAGRLHAIVFLIATVFQIELWLQDFCDKRATLGGFPHPPAPLASAR